MFKSRARVGIGFLFLFSGSCFAAPTSGFKYFDPTDSTKIPKLLSLTGFYANINAKTVNASAQPFDVNTPLWSDAAVKRRWILLKPGTSVGFREKDDYWDYPDSAIFIKQFALDTVVGDSTSRILWETRLLVNHKEPDSASGGKLVDRWYGFSYKWKADQSDAELIPDAGLNTSIRVYRAGRGNPSSMKKWSFPSRSDCWFCHRTDVVQDMHGRGVLGFFTAQLNRPSAANPKLNQLDDFFQKGILNGVKPADWNGSPRWYAVTDSTIDIDIRARGYLAANCSGCHGVRGIQVGATWSPINYDFYDMTPHGEMRGQKVVPFGLDTVAPLDIKPALIVPGYPEKSVALFRQISRNDIPDNFEKLGAQMPPLATFEVNTEAADVLRQWIQKMAPLSTHAPMGKLRGRSAHVAGNKIVLSADAAESAGSRIKMKGFDGREYDLVRTGIGVYAMPPHLAPGIYFLKTGATVIPISLL